MEEAAMAEALKTLSKETESKAAAGGWAGFPDVQPLPSRQAGGPGAELQLAGFRFFAPHRYDPFLGKER